MPPGFSGVGVVELQDALRLEPRTGSPVASSHLGSSDRSSTPSPRSRPASPTTWCASARSGRPARRETRADRRSPWGRAASGASYRATQLHAVDAALRCAIGRELDRDDGQPPLPRVRHHTRAARRGSRVNGRRNAVRNPNAIYRDPMTLDDYMNVRMISTPLCLYDCDVPADGSTAVVDLASRSVPPTCATRRLASKPSARRSTVVPRGISGTTSPPWRCATRPPMMWARTDLTPSDVDVAELYDGFSFITLCWLEALGLLRARRGRTVHRRWRTHRARRRDPPEHPRRSAVRRTVARLWLPARSVRAALGSRRRASGRGRSRGRGGGRRWRPTRRLPPAHALIGRTSATWVVRTGGGSGRRGTRTAGRSGRRRCRATIRRVRSRLSPNTPNNTPQ